MRKSQNIAGEHHQTQTEQTGDVRSRCGGKEAWHYPERNKDDYGLNVLVPGLVNLFEERVKS